MFLQLLVPSGCRNETAPHFGGVNRRFQAKLPQSKNMQRPYYRNYCIDSNQISHGDKDHQMTLLGGPNKCITNPRWRMAATFRNLKTAISLQWFDCFPRNLVQRHTQHGISPDQLPRQINAFTVRTNVARFCQNSSYCIFVYNHNYTLNHQVPLLENTTLTINICRRTFCTHE